MVEPLYPLRCLLAQASQHLWLVDFDDVYREFTCVHHTIHPAPSPPDARRYTVPSRFRCQSGDCGYRVRRLCTGRYLPAHLRRILLMEQQVWSIQLARQSTLRPRVAATTQSDGRWKIRRPLLNQYSLFHIPSDLVVDHWTSDGKSRSHRGVLLLHDVWTASNRLSGHKITSAISMA